MTSIYKFPLGGLWEESEWAIHLNLKVNIDYCTPCKHCHTPTKEETKRYDGASFTNEYVRCPRVVISTNEGGCNSTGVCLDCILEAAETLEKKDDALSADTVW